MKNQVLYITGNSNTFYLFLFPSRTNIRLFVSYFSIHEPSHLKSLYFVLLVMFLIYFLGYFLTFSFFLWCSLILNSWLVGSLKCHTSLTRNPWGMRGGGGGGWGMETLLSGDQYEDCKGFILCPLGMVSITKERLSQLKLSYCSLFTLNKRNMT